MGWNLNYIIDQNQDALGIGALLFGAGRIYSCTIMDEKVYSDTSIYGGFVFLVVFLSFVALANDPGVGEDYSCPHILRYSATLLGTHKVLEDK